MERPTSVMVVGILLLVVASFKLLGALVGTLLFGFIIVGGPTTSLATIAMGFLTLLLSILAIIGASFFLLLRAWARTLLEVLAWLYLAYTAITYGYGFSTMQFAGISTPFMIPFLGFFAMLVPVVLLILLIRFLRSPTVRQACSR